MKCIKWIRKHHLPLPLTADFEIMTTAPNFISLILIGYGVWLSGFTGGVIAGSGIVFYIFCRKARGLHQFE